MLEGIYMSRDYKFLQTLFHLIGIKDNVEPPPLDELFGVKYRQIQRYRVIKPIRASSAFWAAPLDKIPFSVLRLKPGQIIYVRDDLSKNYIDLSYVHKHKEEVSSIDRDVFISMESSLQLLPPNKFYGDLGDVVKQIYQYYRMNKV